MAPTLRPVLRGNLPAQGNAGILPVPTRQIPRPFVARLPRSPVGCGRMREDGSGSGTRPNNREASSVSRSVSDGAAASGPYQRGPRLEALGTPPGREHRPVVSHEQGAGAALRRGDGVLVAGVRRRQVVGLTRRPHRRARRARRDVLDHLGGYRARVDRLGASAGGLGPRLRD